MHALDTESLGLHVPVLGWLYVLANAALLIAGILGLVLLAGIGVLVEDPTALRVLTFVGTLGLILFTVLALPGLIAGVGLLRRRSWGRILALVLGILGLLAFPVGTALGIYAIFVLLQAEAAGFFDHQTPESGTAA
jgi:hypothetical protein